MELHEAGQSLWLDNITRSLLEDGTLSTSIDEYSITGLTSNPTIFDKAVAGGSGYDADIATGAAASATPQEVFFKLALSDLRRAADLFAPIHQRSDGVDGWVSMEVSPLLANDSAATIAQASALHAKAARPNHFIKVPGTPQALPVIEGARPRLLRASTATKNPDASDELYVEASAAPLSINTMPDNTLHAHHRRLRALMAADGGDQGQVRHLSRFIAPKDGHL